MPLASLIIPVYNNVDRFALELQTLEQQTCDLREIEIIVVDDGSTEDVASAAAASSLPIRYLRRPHSGRSATRNAGVQAARGEILIFLDADILVAPDFVAAHIQAHRGPIDLLFGRLLHFPANAYPEAYSRVKAGRPLPDLEDLAQEDTYLRLIEAIFSREQRRATMPWVCCVFSSTSVKRRLIDQVGGFEEGFRGWGVEDVELGYRLFQAGCRFGFLPAVTSYHLDHAKDEARLISDMVRNIKYFYAKYPAPEVALYRRFVAGFVSLEMLERALSGHSIDGQRPGAGETLFKPISYSQAKS